MQNTNRINNFDLLRLLAATQVMMFHSHDHFHLGAGWLQSSLHALRHFPGVPIFFVISGFLIYASYERNQATPKNYFRNRFLRIYPALWVCFLLTLGVLVFFGFLGLHNIGSKSVWAWFAAQVSFLQFYNPPDFRGFGLGAVNGSLWTICIELQFYIFVPLVFWLLRKRSARVLSAFWGFCLVGTLALNLWTATLPHQSTLSKILRSSQLLPYLPYFLMGVFAYRNFERIRPWIEGKVGYWLAAYVAYYLVFSTWLGWYQLYYMLTPISLPAAFLLCGLSLSFAYSHKTLSQKLLRHQDISYGVYIYHNLLLNVMIHTKMIGSMTTLLLYWGATYALAVLSWWLIEKPAIRLKQQLQPTKSVAKT